MKSNRWNMYLSLSWILTLAIAYGIGWWSGVKSMTHVAVGAADTGVWLTLAIIAIVAVGASVATFRMKGFLAGRSQPSARV